MRCRLSCDLGDGAKMTAGVRLFTFSVVYLMRILFVFYNVDCQIADVQLCHMCYGGIQNQSAVWRFCLSKGRIEGRCCFQHDRDNILGLDLSNCSLTRVEDLEEASSAVIIDLSSNPIFNMSDFIFQGFNHLSQLILPIKVDCPGGNTSWDTVDVTADTRLCEGQRNACNQTRKMSLNCPENSMCSPYGPGFVQCSCVDNFHGYKCLREGHFPMLEVMAILSGSTVVVSTLLWVTQRRKIKGT